MYNTKSFCNMGITEEMILSGKPLRLGGSTATPPEIVRRVSEPEINGVIKFQAFFKLETGDNHWDATFNPQTGILLLEQGQKTQGPSVQQDITSDA